METQPQNNLNQPLAPLEPIAPAKKIGLKFGLSMAVIIICLVAAGVAVYWIKTEPIEPTGSNVNIKKTNNETANWQNYQNEEYGFELQYSVKYKPAQDTYGWPHSIVLFTDPSGQSYTFQVEIWNTQNGFKDTYKKDPPFVVATKNGKYITINHQGFEEAAIKQDWDKITSTFKFTDPTASWQTYRNDKYSYEIKYPLNWKASESGYVSMRFSPIDNDNTHMELWAGESIGHGFEGAGNICEEKQIEILGFKTKRTTYCGANPQLITGKDYEDLKDSKFIVIDLFKRENIEYSFEFFMKNKSDYQYETIFNQILSTFKFTP